MEKVLIFLLVVGILMLGICTIAEEISASHEHKEFSKNDLGDPAYGDPNPCG